MTDAYASSISRVDAARWLRDTPEITIATHYKADGDAIGSGLALARAVELRGGRASLWYAGPLPDFAPAVLGDTPFRNLDAQPPGPDEDPGPVVIVDTGAWSQLEYARPVLEGRADRTLIIDHHLHGDPAIADRRVIDAAAPAAAQIIADICRELLGEPPSRFPVGVATPLYLGIATDTGWFRFSNVRPDTMRLVGDLMEAGVDHTELYRLIEQRDRAARLRLLGRALTAMEIHDGGRVALTLLDTEDFKATGAAPGDTGGFADRMLAIESVQVAVVCSASTDHDGKPITKISFRSKPGPDAVDVNDAARNLSGGGHARAAGARLTAPLPEARDAVLGALGITPAP
jgi:bifunctional oligoribonuclease and PAP phosphatase NrnA